MHLTALIITMDYRPMYLLAESEGFEPSVPKRYTGFRDQLLQPLGQLSIYNQLAKAR